jgi:hypothetical protein
LENLAESGNHPYKGDAEKKVIILWKEMQKKWQSSVGIFSQICQSSF